MSNTNDVPRLPGAPLPPGPWLVFVPAPGDEVRLVGGSLARARACGIAVGLVYTQAGPGPAAAEFLPEVRREFFADAGVSPQARDALAGLIREIDPETVFLPSPFSADAGLRSMVAAMEAALAQAGYRKALWSYDESGEAACNRFVDVSDFVEGKHWLLGRLPAPAGDVLARTRLVEALRARHVPGATAAEGFWAVEAFEPGRTSAATLSDLLRRAQPPAAGEHAAAVSVVVRTRDRPELLREALASLALQTYPALDVVVVNDGGASVRDLVSGFAGDLSVRLIELDASRGRSAAANLGIEAARGAWLLMLDDDDVYLPGGVHALVAAATDGDAVYFGKVESVRYAGGQRESLRWFGAPYDADLMAFENQIPFVGCLMPLAHVRAVGGVDEALDCFEDWDLYLRLAQRCRFEFVDAAVAEYRSFGETFISGRGGLPQQERGLSRIFARHLQCGEPVRLARAQIAVKQALIPREVQREAAQAVREARESEIALREQMLASHVGGLAMACPALLVSVIIVNYNGRHHLEKCLPSLFATRQVAFEVILVDNGSKDDSVEWVAAQWPRVRVIAEQHNHGFGRANLIGVQAARGEYVALLNSDTVVTPDWLLHLLRPLLTDPGIGTTCSQLRLLSRPQLLNARGGGMSRLGFGYDIDFGVPCGETEADVDAAPVDVLFPSGAAMLMRKREFLDMGAFDPSYFMYHEDVDLGWRYWLLGQRVVMCPRSVVFHAFGGTTEVEMGNSWRHAMGNRHNLRALWKNYELRHALGATWRLFAGWLRGGHFGFALHVLTWNLVHVRGTWRERRRMQSRRRMSDAELFQRGLITDVVPPQPDLSVVPVSPDAEPLIVNPCLWPDRSSALGRLGAGWYLPERVNGFGVRATAGRASARLQLTPRAKGVLRIEMHVPQVLCGRLATHVVGNDSQQRFTLDENAFWQTLTLPVQADAGGRLAIRIDTPTWSSHGEFRNGDMRKLGCFVRKIVFEPAEAGPVYAPQSVTVLITTYKRWEVLDRTLTALLAQTWPDFDVVVVDDGSADGTWEKLQAWRDAHPGRLALQVFTQENTGQGIARNNGLAHARGDLVLFIGDDTIPEQDFVAQHVRTHQATGMPCAVVGYTQWDREGMKVTPLLDYVNEGGHQFGYRYMKDGEDVPYTCFYTSNISVSRDVLGAQPFDPMFRTYGWEDIDLGYRMSRRGLRIVYNSQARVHHCHPMALEDFYARQVKVGASIGTIYAIHPGLMQDPLMPPATRPRSWKLAARLVVPLLMPLVSWLDSKSIRLPERLYRAVLSNGFWIGRDQGVPRGPGAGKKP